MKRQLCLALLPVLAGCDFDDTVIAPVGPGIVVHAVMRPDQPQQFVLVEQLFDGVIDRQRNVQPAPPGALQTPVPNALVTVSNLDLPTDPCGATVQFDRRPVGSAPGSSPPGIYWSPPGCPTMRPGDRLALEVAVPGLGTVVGTTRVPGLDVATVTVAGRVATSGDTLLLNRDTEALDIAVDARFQRALQIVSYRSGTAPTGAPPDLLDPTLSLMLFVDATSVRVPGTVRHVFARGTGEASFHGGRQYDLVVGVADSNYYDFIRSSNNEITGRGFINRLRGGIGVFGSMLTASYVIEAQAEIDDSREGAYRLTGTLQGVDIDVEVGLYLAPGTGAGEVSGLLRGMWFYRGFLLDGTLVSFPLDLEGQSVDGQLSGDTFNLVIPTLLRLDMEFGRLELTELHLMGAWRDDGPFVVEVSEPAVTGLQIVGQLTATKQ